MAKQESSRTACDPARCFVREIRTTAERITAASGLNAVTRLLADRAISRAELLDGCQEQGAPGPLAGKPFLAKDLFDVAGLATTAGARVKAGDAPAPRDAALIAHLEQAGAILVGTTNMDAFAYGFSTENAWTGRTLNPHNPAHMAGGSSGGSAAAVAARLVPLALGSDTNGSIRVPASLCGIYGLKPTHGRLNARGMFPFADSFDDPGPFASNLADITSFWSVATGEPLDERERSLSAARLVGWFADRLDPEVETAIAELCASIDAGERDWEDAEAARSGAFLMTAAEGGALHHDALAQDAEAIDPAVRDRLLAGTLIPARDYIDARRLMKLMRDDLDRLFGGHDILITPATPATAPAFDRPVIRHAGAEHPARSHLGIFTQPFTFLGLPAMSVPLRRPGRLPLGAQLVARPGREAELFAFAAQLERAGLTGVSLPPSKGAHP